MLAQRRRRRRRRWQFAKVNGVVEENPSARGNAGAAAGGQHTRAQAHVQPERGVRQAPAQGSHVRVRKTPVPDRNAQAGHHVHQLYDRTAAVDTVVRGRRRTIARPVRLTPARHPVRAVLTNTDRVEMVAIYYTTRDERHRKVTVYVRLCKYQIVYAH